VDTFGYAGYETVAGYDALLAKVIVWSPGGYQGALAKAGRALAEFRIEGVETNVGFLRRLLSHPDVRANRIHTCRVALNCEMRNPTKSTAVLCP
jgi:pyruvate carboxylase